MVIRHDLRLAGRYHRVGVHQGDDGLDPLRDDFDIGIQQHIVFGLYLCQCEVVASGKATVAAVFNQTDLREMRLHESDRIVGRGIVGHDDLRQSRVAVGNHRRKETFQERLPILVQYDDSHFFHAFSVFLTCFHLRCDQSQLSGCSTIKRSTCLTYCSTISFFAVSFGLMLTGCKVTS